MEDGGARFGEGPIEQLAGRALGGELPLPEARALAAGADVVAQLNPEYLDALLRYADDAARGAAERPALWLQDLVVAATSAAAGAGPEASAVATRAGLAYIELARGYLTQVPDGRIYRRALELGSRIEAQAREADDRNTLSSALHQQGTLNLDPYAAGRSTENFWEAHRRWLDRMRAEVGGALQADELGMPEPLDAFRRAEPLLGQAAELRTGAARGRSLKAKGDAMLWRRVLGDPLEAGAVAATYREALADLAIDEDPQHRLAALNALRVLGEPLDLDDVERTFDRSLDDWRSRLGPALTRDLIVQSYGLLRFDRPRRALALILDGAPVFDELGEEARIGRLRAEVTLLAALAELDDDAEPLPGPGELEPAVDALLGRAREEDWDRERLFGAIMRLIVACPQHDEEATGLALLSQARENVAPLLARRHATALDWLAAGFELGVGVNGFNREEWADAVEGYSRSLHGYLDLEMPSTALDCLGRVADIVERGHGGPSLAVALLRGVAPVALEAENAIGPAAARTLRTAVERILGDSAADHTPDVLLFAAQLAKGLRFATALYGGSRYRWSEDRVGRQILGAIGAAEAESAADGDWAELDENVLLAEYVSASDAEADAGDPRSRLRWLRRSYDEHLWEALLDGAAVDEALWLDVADLQAALDDRTALLSYFVGARPADGQTAASVLVVTREQVRPFLVQHGIPPFQGLVVDGQSMPSPTGFAVAATREAVQARPGADRVSAEGADALEHDWWSYFGDGAVLDGLREQGVDHLCAIPHGPLHYHPLHLAGTRERPLADDWIVSYLPNLHLFVSRRGRPAARRHRSRVLTAIGLGFEGANPHDLPPLPGAVDEAEAVAKAFGGTLVPEPQATEAAVAQALEDSRFVHLATHGRHDADAPAFQCLYLTPDAGSDGRLQAHELLSLDLRGLDLVTLSACETALGRFDASDNLRGLPAALMLSGVSTVVGTLWEVEDETSERFFTELYQRLRAGDGCLDAFRGAQTVTRADHPQYRDWGAFYLAGDWEWR
jgi:CHAT domain-containing protein